jgi:hypothetical protein
MRQSKMGITRRYRRIRCTNCLKAISGSAKQCPKCGKRFPHLEEPARSHVEKIATYHEKNYSAAHIASILNERRDFPADGRLLWQPHDIRQIVHDHLSRSHTGGIGVRGWKILAGLAVLLGVIVHPFPHYYWTRWNDTAESYEGFVKRFPSSRHSSPARERIRILREPEVWSAAQAGDEIEALLTYIKVYPDGKHLEEAKTRVEELADAQWTVISGSRSLAEITNFLNSYPATRRSADAEARIQELFNEWEWVREQDSLDHYERFSSRNPSHPQREWILERIIDLEVKQIAAGEHINIPTVKPLSVGGFFATVQVQNETGYVLTVWYSGPKSQKFVIPKGGAKLVFLRPGMYQVAASVSAGNVKNYYGTSTMHEGHYSSSYYIDSDSAGLPISGRLPSPRGIRGRLRR